MTINCIFEIVEKSLYSVQYSDEDINEFRKLFTIWTDAEYLESFFESFFESHKIDLQSGFYNDMSA